MMPLGRTVHYPHRSRRCVTSRGGGGCSLRFLNSVDYTVIAIYALILIGMGVWLQRRASQNLEAYFLAGRKLPWWALGVSGMLAFLDMTGTMIIVSFLYILGPRGIYIEFRGGAVLVLAFMMLWTGKWYRRSNCMTGAEWQVYRFGLGPDAKAARVISALSGILFTFGMLAYLIKGAGLFLSMFVPFTPLVCAVLMVGLTTVYTVTAGFLGVVYTDLFQSLIVLVSVIVISVMAALHVRDYTSQPRPPAVVAAATQPSGTEGAEDGAAATPAPAGPKRQPLGGLAALAYEVTGSKDWMSSAPHTYTWMPKGYEDYKYLFWFAFFYLFRNVLGGMTTGADPRYFGARNERECGLLTFFWTWLMTFRWPMMMGFAVLGVFLIKELFPDQSVLRDSQIAIKQHYVQRAQPGTRLDFEQAARVDEVVPQAEWDDILKRRHDAEPETIARLQKVLGAEWLPELRKLADQQELVGKIVPKHKWEDLLALLIQHGEQREPELTARLQKILGDRWDEKLNLVKYEGTVNPERILPAVILMMIPKGLRGLFVVSLVAAAMSTFAPTVNTAVAVFTRDIYQAFLRKKATNFELMGASYAFGLFLVAGGFAMAYTTTSINDIWDWIIMGLGTALFVPGLLRMYWWRFNGVGVVLGSAIGLGFAFLDRGLKTMGFFDWLNKHNTLVPWFKWNAIWEFMILTILCLGGCIIGTYLAGPTDRRVLEHFYKTTRPFGFWKPLHYTLSADQLKATKREHFYDIITVPFALMWQITLFILPMQAIIGAWDQFWVTLVIFLVSLGGVLVLWYPNLPPARDGVENGGDLELIRSFYEKPEAAGGTAPARAEALG
ncbi:MAG: sodium:solute symporter [Planctomycetes bacterium]|nr:sodium:solute symporter [Planctomycetota bacterium]